MPLAFVLINTEIGSMEDVLQVLNDIPNVKNGSGKSTFVNAFYYSLYGKTIKPLNIESGL